MIGAAPGVLNTDFRIVLDSELSDDDPFGDGFAKGYAEGYKAKALELEQ